jgi:FtsP/CotA-like multicopper oxidase with cupredoxin domain
LDGTPLADRVQIAAAADPSKLAASPDGKGNAALSWREGDRLRILLVHRNGVPQGTAVTISGVSNGWEGWITGESTVNGVALSPSGRLLATWPSGRLILGQL